MSHPAPTTAKLATPVPAQMSLALVMPSQDLSPQTKPLAKESVKRPQPKRLKQPVGAKLDLRDHTVASPAASREPPPNLAEVLRRITEMTTLPLRKQQDMKSAINGVGRVLSRPLREIPTDPVQLRTLLAKASPAMALMSRERWTQVRSLLLGALDILGIDVMPGRAKEVLSPAWTELFALLTDRKCRYGLSRVVHFFSREGVEPPNVDEAALSRFHDALAATSLRGNPETTFRTAIRFWKRAADMVPGWPSIGVTMPDSKRTYALAPDQFPASFQTDVVRFLGHSANQDPFAEDYSPSVKLSTINVRRLQIWQIASALVASGKAINEITDLGVLVAPDNAKAALRFLLDRKTGAKGVGLAQQANLVRTIARYWVKSSESAIQKLRGFASGLTPKRRGMVTKNRDRLQQFDLKANVDVLVHLPARVFREVEKAGTGSHKDARRVMFALAVEILIVAPMRVENLCWLDLDQHLVDIRRGRARQCCIGITTTKTKIRFERRLPVSSSAMIDTFVSKYRNRVEPSAGTLLFPGRDGAKRAVTRFSTAISEFIYRETGLVMHPHLFRHLAVKLHMAENPDDMETARLILGHTSSVTTERSYAENRADGAFKRWNQTLVSLRGKLDEVPTRVGTGGRKALP